MHPLLFRLLRGEAQNPLSTLMMGLTDTRPAWKRYGYAILSVILALGVSLAFQDIFNPNPFLLFFGAVTFSAWYGGLKPGLLAVVLTVLFVNYYFLSPDDFELSTHNLIRIGIFAVIAATFSMLHYLDILRIQEQAAFQITLSSIGDGVIVTDRQSKVVYLNHQAEKLTGWTQEEASGKPLQQIFTIFSEETREPVENPIQKVLRENRMVGLTNHTVLRMRDGSEISIADSGSPIRMQDGRILGAVLVFRDVSQEQVAARALRESENRFRTVADTAPAMIWMADTDKFCIYFNQPWLQFTGRTLEQELGNGWTEGVHPDDLEQCLATYRASFDRREDFTMEYRLRRHDGVYRWILDSGVPRHDIDDHFTGYIGSCIDITDRKRNEVLLATLQSITAALLSAATIEDVADVIVSKAKEVFGGSIASVVMLSEDGSHTKVIRSQGAPEEINRDFQTFDINSDYPIVDSIREQKTIWLENLEAYLAAYPHMAEIQKKTGTQAIVCLPFTINEKTIGALGLAFKSPVELTPADRGFMTALAQQCAQAMERAQLSERAKEGVAIEERHRLARDLHDTISQSLFAITITAETLPHKWQKKPDETLYHLERLLLLGRGAHATTRVMLLELRPDLLVSGPIGEQFQHLAAMLVGRKSLNLSLEISPDIDEPHLPPPVHEALYRISQEAVNNIINHSAATEVDMHLTKEADVVRLFIYDNGRGFNENDITPTMGVPTMRKRAEAIGAQFELISRPQQGTSVRVEWRPDN